MRQYGNQPELDDLGQGVQRGRWGDAGHELHQDIACPAQPKSPVTCCADWEWPVEHQLYTTVQLDPLGSGGLELRKGAVVGRWYPLLCSTGFQVGSETDICYAPFLHPLQDGDGLCDAP